jgi:hypothetical protein
MYSLSSCVQMYVYKSSYPLTLSEVFVLFFLLPLPMLMEVWNCTTKMREKNNIQYSRTMYVLRVYLHNRSFKKIIPPSVPGYFTIYREAAAEFLKQSNKEHANKLINEFYECVFSHGYIWYGH